ncbi:MAG: polysaccharide biosynthesis protein [Aquabacterium sp.]
MPLTNLNITRRLLALPRTVKRGVVVCADALWCALCVWVAFGLRLDEWPVFSGQQWIPTLASLAIALPIFAACGLYHAVFRYAGWAAMMAVLKASVFYGVVYMTLFTLIGVPGVPASVGLVQPVLMVMGVIGARILARYWLGGFYRGKRRVAGLPRVLIYGAGAAGRQLAAVLNASLELIPVGFIDDDTTLQGNAINGLTVHPPKGLSPLVEKYDVTDVLLAIPSAGREQRNQIINALAPLGLRVRTLPGLLDLATGRVQAGDLRDLEIEDLLGRDPVAPNTILLNRNVRGKVVLVTGAGGSIGGELCRQILSLGPSRLLMVDASEFALYSIHQELQAALPRAEGEDPRRVPLLVPLLASVQDSRRIDEILSSWRPHTVYHAAAYKHVPLVEHNPAEGVRNNVLGTLNTALAAASHGVSNFVLISTDKAVRPTNIMGASKRLAEQVLQALAAETAASRTRGTCFSMVRFGNVLGSSGSVVPLFRQQIRDGGPVTLTHADITRYFMTIPEAAQLVIQSGAMAQGGEVFVLDMGESVKIIDLARRMVELSGLSVRDDHNPEGDIEIVVTGLRPGEKLYEELLIGDNPEPTMHPRIMKAHDDHLPWTPLRSEIDRLGGALDDNDVEAIRSILRRLVPEYQPADDVVDWVHLQRAKADAA